MVQNENKDWIIVSTHSPARGLTVPTYAKSGAKYSFNSQPRKGADKIAVIV